MGALKGLVTLDISSNKLSGPIPGDLKNLQALQLVNLSFNNLEGEVPTGGIFNNMSRVHLEGNPKFCFTSACEKSRDKKSNYSLYYHHLSNLSNMFHNKLALVPKAKQSTDHSHI